MHITTTHLGKIINIMVHTDRVHFQYIMSLITTESNRVQPQKGNTLHPHGHRFNISNQLIHRNIMSVLEHHSTTEDQWNAHLALEDPNLLPLTG